MSRPRQGRLVVLINSAGGLGLIAVIATISVSRHGAKPPSLTEFAPAGGGSLHSLQASAAPSVPPTAVRPSAQPIARPVGVSGVPRQLACYGWPDGSSTQTFDPQSPPCVSSWDVVRGNGGATATGVTGSTIRVGVPRKALPAARSYASFLNSHFQLYGRSLQMVDLGAQDMRSDTGQQAAAEAAAQQQVFAVLVDPVPGPGPAAAPTQFLDVAAAHHVVSLLSVPSQASSTGLSALSPYAWSYDAGLDRLQQAAGTLVCQQLAGRRASYSGTHSDDNRRFGVLVPDAAHAGGNDLDVQTLLSALDDCHSPAHVERVDPTSPAASRDALLRLKMAGVTSVLPYVTAPTVARVLMPAAEEDGFRPEWVLTGIDAAASDDVWSTAPKTQVRSLFGLASWERPAGLRPAVQAASGGPADESAYHALLELASGIQSAGPTLTPDAFARGLSGTAFPNPGAARRPLFQASVGFDDLDHAMVDDIALAWWQKSGFCLVGNGTRWGFTGLPANDPGLFSSAKGCG
jgi:hypothetical protein